jgi:hypothetical protein
VIVCAREEKIIIIIAAVQFPKVKDSPKEARSDGKNHTCLNKA